MKNGQPWHSTAQNYLDSYWYRKQLILNLLSSKNLFKIVLISFWHPAKEKWTIYIFICKGCCWRQIKTIFKHWKIQKYQGMSCTNWLQLSCPCQQLQGVLNWHSQVFSLQSVNMKEVILNYAMLVKLKNFRKL